VRTRSWQDTLVLLRRNGWYACVLILLLEQFLITIGIRKTGQKVDFKSVFSSELPLSFAILLSTTHQGHLYLMENQSPVLCVEQRSNIQPPGTQRWKVPALSQPCYVMKQIASFLWDSLLLLSWWQISKYPHPSQPLFSTPSLEIDASSYVSVAAL